MGDLLAQDVSDDEARVVAKRNLAEPLTAFLTIPFIFINPAAWDLSWFLYPFLQRFFCQYK